MQIHELTKRRKTNEGLLDNVKSAVSAAKTGYAAGKAGTGSTLGAAGTALGTFGKAITDPGFAAQSNVDANSKAAMDKYNALKKKYGWADKDDAPAGQQAGTGQPAAPLAPEVVKQQATAMVQQFTQEPDFSDLTAVLPDPGHILTVKTKNGGSAYKDESGQWFTVGEKGPVPANDKAKMYYEKLIDVDQYEQALAPPSAPANANAGKSKQIEEAVGNKKVQSIVNRLIQKNRAAEAAAQKAAANPAAAPKVEKAKQQVDKAASMTRKSAPNRKAKTNMVKQALMNYATAIIQGGGAAPAASEQPGQPGAEQTTPGQQGAQQAGTTVNPAVQQAQLQDLKKLGAQDSTIADLTKILKTPQGPSAIKKVVGVAESRKPLTQRLEEALQLLNEGQVAITKDIHVRTKGGDYIKRASDQTWYDPNGVAIDPVKYADYVKRLDGTPQAQTQYQKDAAKAAQGIGPGGTDTGFKSDQEAKKASAQTPPPPPQAPQQPAAAPQQAPDPLQQIADQQKLQQFLRNRDVGSLNAQIKDTTEQLRNAQIFGTGQEDYLKQQLAQLIAMKV